MNLLERMNKNGVSQVDMIRTIKQRNNIIVQPAEMSSIMNGVLTTPKAERVLKAVEGVLDEIEA